MILAAAVLILLGLGLFVAGVMSGEEVFYWGCVAACVVAAVLLFLARKQQPSTRADGPPAGTPKADDRPVEAATTGSTATGAPGPSADAEAASAGTGERSAAAAPAAHAVAEPGADGGRHGVHDLPDPPIEEVEVTDLLLVVDLTDEVLVLDERPRYHLAGCVHLRGHTPIPLPIDEARSDGFTPCAVCAPDRNLAERVRARRAGRG